MKAVLPPTSRVVSQSALQPTLVAALLPTGRRRNRQLPSAYSSSAAPYRALLASSLARSISAAPLPGISGVVGGILHPRQQLSEQCCPLPGVGGLVAVVSSCRSSAAPYRASVDSSPSAPSSACGSSCLSGSWSWSGSRSRRRSYSAAVMLARSAL